jgi:hypothetical protein
MEFISGYDQFVSNPATNNEQDNLRSFYIIQHTKITHTQFELGQRIWSELLDRPSWSCRSLATIAASTIRCSRTGSDRK